MICLFYLCAIWRSAGRLRHTCSFKIWIYMYNCIQISLSLSLQVSITISLFLSLSLSKTLSLSLFLSRLHVCMYIYIYTWCVCETYKRIYSVRPAKTQKGSRCDRHLGASTVSCARHEFPPGTPKMNRPSPHFSGSIHFCWLLRSCSVQIFVSDPHLWWNPHGSA